MRALSLILLALALLLLGGLARMTVHNVSRDAPGLLASATRRAAGPTPEYEAALDELEMALRIAQNEGDVETIAGVLLRRGTILRRLHAVEAARADFELLLARYRPGDEPVILQLVGLDVLAGDRSGALERVDALLQESRDSPTAWGWRGRLLVMASDERIAECNQHLYETLPRETAQQGRELVHRLTGMTPEDPLRSSVMFALRELFPTQYEANSREVMRLVGLASEEVTQAREALVESFAGPVRADSALEYLKLLQRGGHDHAAVDFGLAISTHRSVQRDLALMGHLAAALIGLGRAGLAADLIDERLSRRTAPDSRFFRTWCEALVQAQRWPELAFVANQMRIAAEGDEINLPRFYAGLAMSHTGQTRAAAGALERCLAAPAWPMPYAGAEGEAWRLLAACRREEGGGRREWEALRMATELGPDASGEAWLRLAELTEEYEPRSLWEAEEQFAHGMRLLPERLDELMPRWREIGERHLAQTQTRIELEADRLANRGRFVPQARVGAYELLRLAETWWERGKPVGVISAASRLLQSHPGLLPALDLRIRAFLATEDWQAAGADLLERLEHDGAADGTLRRLRALPEGVLTPEQQLRVMRLDPTRTGRIVLARGMRERGEQQRALDGLLSLGLDEFGEAGRLLAAQLLLDLEQPGAAVELLEDLPEDSPRFGDALLLRLQAAAATDSDPQARSLLEPLAARSDLDREAVIARCLELRSAGLLRAARAGLMMLDVRADTRGSDVMLALGVTALLAGDSTLALESLDRAEAFETDGSPALGRVLLALQDRAWSHLPSLARDLHASGLEPNPIQAAILAVLHERLAEGSILAAAGLREEPNDLGWMLATAVSRSMLNDPIEIPAELGESAEPALMDLLHGEAGRRRYPRDSLGLLLALESPPWLPWAVARLDEMVESRVGGPWSAWLLARAHQRLGDGASAIRVLREATGIWPDFAPCWDLLEHCEEERLGRPDHMDLLRLRYERRQALGPRSGEESEDAIVRALSLERAGNVPKALEAARAGGEPRSLLGRTVLARLLHKAGEQRAALEIYREASLSISAEALAELVPELLTFLGAAGHLDPEAVPIPTISGELDHLSRRLPRDARVALARAAHRLDIGTQSWELRVRRAFDVLDDFRAATGGASISSLSPDAVRGWKELLQELDPARAERFVRGELPHDAGSLELWLMLGETLEAQARYPEAIAHYELVLRMMPEAATRGRAAALLASYGVDHDRTSRMLERLEAMKGSSGSDLAYWRARSQARSGGLERSQAIAALAQLWAQPTGIEGEVSRAEVARLYGTLLVQRGQKEDADLAAALLEEARQGVEDPVQLNLILALAHLARQIP